MLVTTSVEGGSNGIFLWDVVRQNVDSSSKDDKGFSLTILKNAIRELRDNSIFTVGLSSDNGSNVKSAGLELVCSQNAFIYIPCVCHSIQLMLGSVLYPIDYIFTRVKQPDYLHKCVELCGKIEAIVLKKTFRMTVSKSIQRPVPTRWSSRVNMLDSLFPVYEQIELALEKYNILWGHREWFYLAVLTMLLRPFAIATDVAGTDSIRLSSVVEIFQSLKKHYMRIHEAGVVTAGTVEDIAGVLQSDSYCNAFEYIMSDKAQEWLAEEVDNTVIDVGFRDAAAYCLEVIQLKETQLGLDASCFYTAFALDIDKYDVEDVWHDIEEIISCREGVINYFAEFAVSFFKEMESECVKYFKDYQQDFQYVRSKNFANLMEEAMSAYIRNRKLLKDLVDSAKEDKLYKESSKNTQMKLLFRNEDLPIEFKKQLRFMEPIVVALGTLSPTEASSERAFSVQSFVMNQHAASLSDDSTGESTFCRFNFERIDAAKSDVSLRGARSSSKTRERNFLTLTEVLKQSEVYTDALSCQEGENQNSDPGIDELELKDPVALIAFSNIMRMEDSLLRIRRSSQLSFPNADAAKEARKAEQHEALVRIELETGTSIVNGEGSSRAANNRILIDDSDSDEELDYNSEEDLSSLLAFMNETDRFSNFQRNRIERC